MKHITKEFAIAEAARYRELAAKCHTTAQEIRDGVAALIEKQEASAIAKCESAKLYEHVAGMLLAYVGHE